ncbi:MAG: hypothetical protein AAF756_11210 [Pseudomonadota bacterium]
MGKQNIEDFYYNAAEILGLLYAMFPVRSILMVEDISGPIKWDNTGLPDRRSQACFESMVWLCDHGLLEFRSIEDRNTGIEGAVLTQKAFVLLTSPIVWEGQEPESRIDALTAAKQELAYVNINTLVADLLRANCYWVSPSSPPVLSKHQTLNVLDEAE